MTPGRLAGRVAVVTGAGQGIGAGIARRFAGEGAHVVVSDVDLSRARHVADEIRAGGGIAWAERFDVSVPAEAEALAAAIEARSGRLDVLVNNAAITDTSGFSETTLEHFRRVCAVNLEGVLIASMAFVPLMRRGSGGRILHIASILGLRGSPGALAYQTAKGGVINLTRAMACDLAPDGITVNALAPGFIDTPMCILPDGTHEHAQPWFQEIYLKWGRIPLRRAGLPEDVAGPAVFFCSDDSRYVTGQVLGVDGGLSATF